MTTLAHTDPPGAPEQTQPMLQVRGLSVEFGRPRRRVRAVRSIDLDVRAGETVAIVGESGSGKSSAARGILQLVRPAAGSVRLDGRELVGLKGAEMRRARRDLQMVFQDPYSSMNPAMTIEEVIGEPLMVHTEMRRSQRRTEAEQLLELVGLRREHASRYPYEFSGGQRQRIAIARALALRPRLLVADEAVSALDVSSQNQVLTLLDQLSTELGIACLFISHDLGVVRHIADRVAVMYLGSIVEQGTTESLFDDPQHPYTRALLSAALVADPERQAERTRIKLRGELPDPANPPAGCAFSSRCPAVMAICHQERPVLTPRVGDGSVACHLTPAGTPAAATEG